MISSLRLFKLAALTLFIGRGWKYLFWDAPFRSILWSQDLLKNIVETYTSYTWQEYVSSPAIDSLINSSVKFFGVSFILLALLTIFLTTNFKKGSKALFIGSFFMVFMIFTQFVSKFFYIGVFLEHGVQMGAPILFYFALHKSLKSKSFVLLVKVLLASTFIGHALFALGFHPVPGNFIDMIISILGVSEDHALHLLVLAGSLDIIASLLLFFKKSEKYSLYFMIFWGTATAFARILANLNLDLILDSTNQWLLETIYRLPHALIPLALLFYFKESRRDEGNSSETSLSKA